MSANLALTGPLLRLGQNVGGLFHAVLYETIVLLPNQPSCLDLADPYQQYDQILNKLSQGNLFERTIYESMTSIKVHISDLFFHPNWIDFDMINAIIRQFNAAITALEQIQIIYPRISGLVKSMKRLAWTYYQQCLANHWLVERLNLEVPEIDGKSIESTNLATRPVESGLLESSAQSFQPRTSAQVKLNMIQPAPVRQNPVLAKDMFPAIQVASTPIKVPTKVPAKGLVEVKTPAKVTVDVKTPAKGPVEAKATVKGLVEAKVPFKGPVDIKIPVEANVPLFPSSPVYSPSLHKLISVKGRFNPTKEPAPLRYPIFPSPAPVPLRPVEISTLSKESSTLSKESSTLPKEKSAPAKTVPQPDLKPPQGMTIRWYKNSQWYDFIVAHDILFLKGRYPNKRCMIVEYAVNRVQCVFENGERHFISIDLPLVWVE